MNIRVLENDVLWAGAAASLVDDHTGNLPVTSPTVAIDVSDGAGGWRALAMKPVVTNLGTYVFPRLEKRGDARNVQPRKYRLRVSAPGYTPYYLFDRDGVVIDVYPYDDTLAPTVPPFRPEIIPLYPAAAYPFETSALIYGKAVDSSNAPVPFALVSCHGDRVLTDEDGAFVLPLGRSPTGQVLVDASDRNGNTATPLPVSVPQGLGQHYTINF